MKKKTIDYDDQDYDDQKVVPRSVADKCSRLPAIVCRSYQSLCVVIRIAHIIIVILIFIAIALSKTCS